MNVKINIFYWLLILIVMTACSNQPKPSTQATPNAGRYQQDTDSIPQRLPTYLEMTDPTPQTEQLSRGGNKPYQLFGQHYTPLINALEHDEAGIASWYGNKFHGHLTSNGEIYNMFAMTAAHKTLPLPSYVRVTNLDNMKSAIVRVNDRGPFHRDRIIDLSYSAAHKLDMLKQGTARVQLELLQSPAMLASAYPAEQCFIQVFASGDNKKLTTLQQQLKQQQLPSEIRSAAGIYRLLVGPTTDKQQAQQWLQYLRRNEYPSAYFSDSHLCS